MLLVYGSYGDTGRLVVERALEALDDEVVLAGRDAGAVETQAVAADRDLAARPFTLEHDAVVRDRLRDADAVLNCAGPFRATADPLVGACLDTGTHYLDVTGEISVFEALAEYDAAAARRDLTVLPGVGFDVVPTDCLAASLAADADVGTDTDAGADADAGDEVAGTAELALAIRYRGGLSSGTLRTVLERSGEGGAVRRDGRIQRVPLGHDVRTVDFDDGEGPTPVLTVPWGDVATAYRSTGVPDVTTYAAVPRPVVALRGIAGTVGTVLSVGPIRRAATALADRLGSVPDAGDGRPAHVWGELRTEGRRRVARAHVPGIYGFTARTAVESARRVLAGEAPGGVHTPSSAFGADYLRSFEGVTVDGPEPADGYAPDADAGSDPAP